MSRIHISLADDVRDEAHIDAQNARDSLGTLLWRSCDHEAGNDPSLACIYAALPGPVESVHAYKDPPPGAPVPPILPPRERYLFLDNPKSGSICRGVDRKERRSWPTPRFRGAWARSAAHQRTGVESKPSWYLVATMTR